MPNLTDTQSILLSAASRRADLSLYPLPEPQARSGGTGKSIAALIKAGFAEEREAGVGQAVSRTDGDIRFGVFATAAGLAAIGIEAQAQYVATDPASDPAPRATKTSLVLDLMRRNDGAIMAELIAATGWLPHTTRAALTGLRKKGHAIERSKRDGQTCCHIGTAA
jgi:hypothetical protein